MTMTPLGDLPRLHAERKPPDAIAVSYPDRELTWRALERKATQRARLFRSLGVRKDDFVTLALPNGAEFHEAAFAIWKLGATPNVVPPNLPRHEFEAIVEIAQPRLVVGGPGRTGKQWVPAGTDVAIWDDSPFPSEVASYWKAITSGGSTGRPKIIVDRTPAMLDPDVPGLAASWNMRADGAVLNPGPLYHNAPFLFSSHALFNGAKVVGMARFDPEEALRLIGQHRINWVFLVPTMMNRIWALPAAVRESFDISSLDAVWHGAAPCPAWLKENWIHWLGGERLWELYGGTEAVGAAVIRGDEWLHKRGSVGKMYGAEIRAVRPDGEPCAPGEIGELYARTPSSSPSHYVGAEARTLSGGWQSIGDIGHVDEDGYIFLSDRRTDLILRGGANIYPAEVEEAIGAYPGVESTIVVGLPCDDLGQRVHAIIHPAEGERLDVGALSAFLAGRLARYKLPESFEFVADPLRDDAGKARRSALRDERAAWLHEGRAFQHRPLPHGKRAPP